jgi:hypothetical protein
MFLDHFVAYEEFISADKEIQENMNEDEKQRKLFEKLNELTKDKKISREILRT